MKQLSFLQCQISEEVVLVAYQPKFCITLLTANSPEDLYAIQKQSFQKLVVLCFQSEVKHLQKQIELLAQEQSEKAGRICRQEDDNLLEGLEEAESFQHEKMREMMESITEKTMLKIEEANRVFQINRLTEQIQRHQLTIAKLSNNETVRKKEKKKIKLLLKTVDGCKSKILQMNSKVVPSSRIIQHQQLEDEESGSQQLLNDSNSGGDADL